MRVMVCLTALVFLCVPVFGAQEVLLDSACRLLDTRSGSPLAASTVYEVDVREQCGVPESATGIVFNLTVVNPAAQGHLRAYGTTELATTSIINYNSGEAVVATGATVKLSVDDENTQGYDPPSWGMRLWSNQQTHVILDVTAYVTELPTTYYRGVITGKGSTLSPPSIILNIDTLFSPLALVCEFPWIDPDHCDFFQEQQEVCGVAHVDVSGSNPLPVLSVHTMTDCQ